MSLRSMLGASRFAHFAAAPAAAPSAATETDDDEAKKAKKAEDEEAAAKKAKDEEEERERARKARKSRRAKKADERDDDDDEDESGDDDEDEDDDEEMKKAAAAGHAFGLDAAFRRGARAQRGRCARIFAAPEAAANPLLAMSLAFETSMTPDAAIAVLKKTPAAGTLSRAMAAQSDAVRAVGPGGKPAPTGEAAIAKSWDAAFAAVAPKA